MRRCLVGDHLSLGPVDLEVVEIANDSFRTPAEFQVPAEERRNEFTVERCHEFLPPSASSGFDNQTPASRFLEPADEQPALIWGQDTIHHTTVWVGDDEDESAEPTEPTEHVDAELEGREEPAVETPADAVPAEAAREVFRQLQAANATSRSRCRKLLAALRESRDAHQRLQLQTGGLANTKDELVAACEGLSRERNFLREQLTTAERAVCRMGTPIERVGRFA